MTDHTTSTDPPTLVLGGTGKTGRRVAQRLTDRGLPVRIGSRSAPIPFDWEDPATWRPALEGAAAVYVSFFPDLAVPGAADAVGTLAALAAEAGARRIVLLSGRGEDEALRSEQTVAAAGIDWTVVRCSWFSQNFSESFLLDAVLAGEIALPVNGVPEPFVDADDIADVAVAALTAPGHAGQVYELTGPRALRFDEAAAEIARATGRPVRFTPVSLADFATGLADQQVPDDAIGLLTYLFTEVLDGRNAAPADGVRRALGREPRDFTEYARRAAAAGAWGGAA